MNSFIARQPIFDAKKKLFAYELLFRTGMSNAFPNIDGSSATSSLLSSSFLTAGIDSILNGKIVFINFTEELLIRGIPMLFPDDKVIIEILEDVNPTDAIVVACQDLKLKGYSLALDDFVYQKNLVPLIKLVRFIKVDFRLTPIKKIIKLISTLKKYQCSLLAEKIETYDEFLKAKELGFRYFQGYFFARPEILKNKEISASQLFLIKLICEINKILILIVWRLLLVKMFLFLLNCSNILTHRISTEYIQSHRSIKRLPFWGNTESVYLFH